jgi:hypothetical protein
VVFAVSTGFPTERVDPTAIAGNRNWDRCVRITGWPSAHGRARCTWLRLMVGSGG